MGREKEPVLTRRGKQVGAPVAIFDDTHAHRPDPFADAERLDRRAPVAPTTWSEDDLTFEAVFATSHPVRRQDARGEFFEVLNPATVNLKNVEGLPVYDAHRGGSARQTIGVIQSARVDGQAIIGTVRLSAAEDVTPIRQRVADGTIRSVSIGYAIAGWTETIDAGQRVKSPTAWVLKELSLVPSPADPNARIRARNTPDDHTPQSGGFPGTRGESNGVNMTEQNDATLEAQEANRRSEIRGIARTAGLDDLESDRLIDEGKTVEEAKALCFDRVQTRAAARPAIRTATAQPDDPEAITRRQSDAIATRMAGGECPEDARQYLGDSVLDIARSSLERAGMAARGMSPDEIFHRAAHGTSDFPLVVSNAMNKTAAQAYRAAESPLKTLAKRRVLRDFKTSTTIRVGGLGRLEQVEESGEITHTSRAENGETMKLNTYARGLTVSRELLVNDDLGLLGDMTAEFGTAAAQTEADVLVNLVTSNPALSDGTPVFDASRGNIAGAGAAISTGGLTDARKFMRQVKGLDGETIISATPQYLLVGPESETAAEEVLATLFPTSVSEVNSFSNSLTLLVEPRITDGRWYVFADPGRLPTLQYGYLASAQGVQIQRADAWDTLGLKFRAYLDFGAGLTDWRGAYLNGGGA